MKILYFDISGTVVREGGRVKEKLARGAFERAVRAAGVQRLVCVSSLTTVLQAYRQAGRDIDEHEYVLGHLGGAVTDEDWFRRTATVYDRPNRRAEALDESADWYYVDDYALEYLQRADRPDLVKNELGRRVLVTRADGDGGDILDWLRTVVAD